MGTSEQRVVTEAYTRRWPDHFNLVLGAWLVLAPGPLGFIAQSGPTWNQVVVGLAIGANASRAVAQGPGKLG